MSDQKALDNGNGWAEMLVELQAEQDQSEREIKEIDMMLNQSRGEVEKLAQRNASITTHLQQVQANIATIPAAEIQTAFEHALDAQQRLVVMRSQLEKLQSDRGHLERIRKVISQVLGKVGDAGTPDNTNAGIASVEMLIQAQEAERQRLSRKMHDGPAQALSNFILQAEIAMRLFEIDATKAREELTSLKAAASKAFQQVREFIYNLRPMMLDDLGLVPTVKRYTDAIREKFGLELNVAITGTERRLEPYLEVLIFRSIQDLLTNISQHSQATEAKLHLDMGEREVRVSVGDNGRGFDTQDLGTYAGVGLKLIKERVEMLGGEFTLESSAGQGAQVSFRIPTSATPALE